jgi:hypothetical protein
MSLLNSELRKTQENIYDTILTDFISEIKSNFSQNIFDINESKKFIIIKVLKTMHKDKMLISKRKEFFDLLATQETNIDNTNLEIIYQILINNIFG